jgi:hypothetical protein
MKRLLAVAVLSTACGQSLPTATELRTVADQIRVDLSCELRGGYLLSEVRVTAPSDYRLREVLLRANGDLMADEDFGVQQPGPLTFKEVLDPESGLGVAFEATINGNVYASNVCKVS